MAELYCIGSFKGFLSIPFFLLIIKEPPLPWLSDSLTPGSAQLFASALLTHSVLLLFSGAYTCSCSSDFQTKQDNFLTWPMQKLPPHQLSLTPRNISVISGFRCEMRSMLQGHFALPVYLQDFYFPLTPEHFFLDLESCFGPFRGCSPAAHPGSSSAMPNPHRSRDGAGTSPGPGIPRCCSAPCSPPAPRPRPRPSGPLLLLIDAPGEVPCAPGLSSEAQAGAGTGNSGGIGWDQAKGTRGEKVTCLAKDQSASS